MTIKLTFCQATLLHELGRRDDGLLKPKSNGSACALVMNGHAEWVDGIAGIPRLRITDKGRSHLGRSN